MTRTIIAGSRIFTDINVVWKATANCPIEITEVVAGGARGIDTLAIEWAKHNNIQFRIFKADWDKYGKSAGPIRNIEMAKNADALLAIWDGSSRGTEHMIQVAKKKGLKVYVYNSGGESWKDS